MMQTPAQKANLIAVQKAMMAEPSFPERFAIWGVPTSSSRSAGSERVDVSACAAVGDPAQALSGA